MSLGGLWTVSYCSSVLCHLADCEQFPTVLYHVTWRTVNSFLLQFCIMSLGGLWTVSYCSSVPCHLADCEQFPIAVLYHVTWQTVNSFPLQFCTMSLGGLWTVSHMQFCTTSLGALWTVSYCSSVPCHLADCEQFPTAVLCHVTWHTVLRHSPYREAANIASPSWVLVGSELLAAMIKLTGCHATFRWPKTDFPEYHIAYIFRVVLHEGGKNRTLLAACVTLVSSLSYL
jgi:hypothetical protein